VNPIETRTPASGVRPSGTRRARKASVARTLTSPDRLVYPDLGITKQQVADYYRAVAPHLLPELVRRPLTLVRCPDGAAGTCFFQKHHADAFGPNVHAFALREKDGGRARYVYVDDVAGVLDLVQMNVLELHLWGSRIDDLEHPDRLIFDLDPGPGVGWKQLVAAAREVRARLSTMGLESFARLSGGKGVHVVLPIRPGPTWDDAKEFCERVADSMAEQAPDRYVASASKALREGLVFVDWLRNTRGATSVASWSLRARPDAGVAVPVSWTELGRAGRGAAYPLARARRRAAGKHADPWNGWAVAIRQRLPKAV
jgi:bifunctional non-homologous end joining protein LigD